MRDSKLDLNLGVTRRIAGTGFPRPFEGELVDPRHPAYDAARRVWNGMIDKYPRLIARCASAEDVAAALAWGRAEGIPIAVRGGGHNVAGYGTCDGGLVVDLSPMREVAVDPTRRTATVGGGAIWADVDEATQRHGLAVPGGEVSATGVAGLTLSGGLGMLRRKHGLTCDSLIAADVVTADGRLVRASASEHPDLLWALRGGGGNFGVVTRFEFALHPVGPEVMKLTVAYPLARARQILHAWRDFTRDAPDAATTAAYSWRIPAMPEFPSELHGVRIVVLEGMYADGVDEGARVFEPLRRLGDPLFDLSGPTTYLESQRSLDWLVPDGQRNYWKSLQLDALSDDAIAGFVTGAARTPPGISLIVLRHLGGAIARVPEDATAYGNRAALFNVSIDAIWSDPADDESHVSWARGLWNGLRASARGVYLNFAGFGEEGVALVRAGHAANYERLARIKARYDPENVFRLNPNVAPSAIASCG